MAFSTSFFCIQKKHIIFSANSTCIFIVEYNNLAFYLQRFAESLLLLEVHVYTPYSALKFVSFKIFGHCSAQK